MAIYDETDYMVTGGGVAGSNNPVPSGAGVNGPAPTAKVTQPVVTFGPNSDITVTFNPEEGRKFDGGKLEYGLLPPKALEATVEILTFGAQKYARDNWKYVDDSKRRYFDAMQRHVWAWKQGEKLDPESGKHHLAHAMCCLMFLYEHDTIYSKED